VQQGGSVRDIGPQIVGMIEPAPVFQARREDDHRVIIGLGFDEMAFIVAAERNEEARVEIHSLGIDLKVVGHRQDHHPARHAIGGVEDAREGSHQDDAARRQSDDGAGGREVRDVERNASGILHRLDRPKRIDIGKADQLKCGGRGEGVEHASGRLLQCDNQMNVGTSTSMAKHRASVNGIPGRSIADIMP
jgi:hypothetical protein